MAKAILITSEEALSNIANIFHSTYLREPDVIRKNIHMKLVNLGDNPSAEDVLDIAPIENLFRETCGGCGRYVDSVVQVGQALDYETQTAFLCRDCVEEAWNLIKDN